MGNVAENLFRHSPQDIAIPSIVVYELYVGIAKSNAPEKRTEQLHELLQHVKIIDFTDQEAKAAADIRAELEKLGMPIGPVDTLIAGCVKANHATLITHNTKEFSRIKELPVKDWY